MTAGLVGASLFGVTVASAGPATTMTSPFSFVATNDCVTPAEVLNGTGTLHFLLSENLSNSGMVQHHLEARLNGLNAVAPVPGALPKKYVVQATSAESFGFDITGMPAHETFETTAHFVRQGEDGTFLIGDDFYVRFFAHITANSNGEVTSFKIEPTMTCR